MIPPEIIRKQVSSGEERFFEYCKTLPDDYVVLHSVGFAVHPTKSYAEADFLIICKEGILCLEVKAGDVEREDGVWCFRDKFGRETRKTEGPFEQAVGEKESARLSLGKHFRKDSNISKCLCACGVVFTDIAFTQKGPDIIPEIIFDARQSLENLHDYVRKCFDYWKDRISKDYKVKFPRLCPSEIEKVTDYFRGDFGFVPSLNFIVKTTGERLLRCTEEQMNLMEALEENPRMLVRGAAGSGKTLLALEHAKRSAMAGKKVLFLCYNQMLARYLKSVLNRETRGTVSSMTLDTLHGFFLSEVRRHRDVVVGHTDVFFQEKLPELFLGLPDITGRFDEVIVDEGQDILRPVYLICIDALLEGGLEKGKWQFFYDVNQNIYNTDFEEGIQYLGGFRPTIFPLNVNCRNTRQVGLDTVLMTGLIPAKTFQVDGESIRREFYEGFSDERKKLLALVKRLRGQGLNQGKITILSPNSFENSCFRGENIFQSVCRFQNITRLSPDLWIEEAVKFCTVQSYKGMESEVVILIDLDSFEPKESRLLNYVAWTRAKSLLYVLCNINSKNEINKMIQQAARNNLLENMN